MSRSWARSPSASASIAAFVDRPLAEELVAEPPGQAAGRGGMIEEQRGQPVGVERAGAAEDRLGRRVVPHGDEPRLVAHELPARQGAGGLLDVVLGIMADPER